MNAPDNFEMVDGYACFRPAGQVSLQQGIDMITDALASASSQEITRLLVDTTHLAGFEAPSVLQRFDMLEQWAFTFSRVKLALVTRPDLIDQEHFGVTVGRNRGLFGNVFSSEPEAVAWLLGQASQ
ncbi:hypothetical protein ACXR0O_17810 [Verrucomicrobiota bacterium sgz303538]